MSRLWLTRVAVILLIATATLGAQDKPVAFNKAFITVTNKSDFELSLGFTLNSNPPSAQLPAVPVAISNAEAVVTNNASQFEIRKTVKPREQITITIPKGDYTVETTTALQTDQAAFHQLPHPSNEPANHIDHNEIWTFELEQAPQRAALGDAQPAEAQEVTHIWKRHIWPVRPSKGGDAELGGNASKIEAVEPASSDETALPKKAPAAPQNLRVVEPVSP